MFWKARKTANSVIYKIALICEKRNISIAKIYGILTCKSRKFRKKFLIFFICIELKWNML